MNYKKIGAGFVTLILFFLIACASTEAPSRQEKGLVQIGVKAEGPALKEAWEVDWEKTLQAARKEGKVVVYATSAGPALKSAGAIPLFRDKYSLNLEIITRGGAQLMATFMAERRAGIYLADVFIVGTNTFFGQIEPAGIVKALDPILMLPEVLDPKNWHGGELPWGNAEHTLFHMYAGPNTMVAINTNLAKVEELKSYLDLLNPKWKGKILMNDPTLAGTGIKSFSVLGWHILDLDFFRQLARQEPLIMRDVRLQVVWLAQGKYPILLFPHAGSMAEFIKAGAPVANVLPEEGSYLSRGGGAISLIKPAANPNAAKVFINWLLSREGQTLLPPAHGLQSARVDVSTEGLDPLRIRKPGVKYFADSDNKEWIARDPEYKKAVLEIFGAFLR